MQHADNLESIKELEIEKTFRSKSPRKTKRTTSDDLYIDSHINSKSLSPRLKKKKHRTTAKIGDPIDLKKIDRKTSLDEIQEKKDSIAKSNPKE